MACSPSARTEPPLGRSRCRGRRLLFRLTGGLLGAFLLAQVIPYGRTHTNPTGREEPGWNSPETRALARRACFDCHSNETSWPWYSHIAPVSWLVQRDVDVGRRHLNFSEWDRPQKKARDAAKETADGEMPPWFYLPLHPEAALDDRERGMLVEGLRATLSKGSPR